MGPKTYIPGAVDLGNAMHKYLTSYQETLVIDKTPEQITALVNLIACIASFLQVWRKPPPV